MVFAGAAAGLVAAVVAIAAAIVAHDGCGGASAAGKGEKSGEEKQYVPVLQQEQQQVRQVQQGAPFHPPQVTGYPIEGKCETYIEDLKI